MNPTKPPQEQFISKKNWAIILLLCVFIIILKYCESNRLIKEDTTINQVTIRNFQKIKKLNQLLIKNIITISDSCCRHSNSCNYDSITRKKISDPINRNLAKKYLSSIEPTIEKLIAELAPSSIQSNDDAIRGNISVRLDSTITYTCYDRMYSDTVITHLLIYSQQINKEDYKEIENIFEKKIDKNWTYKIIKYYDTW